MNAIVCIHDSCQIFTNSMSDQWGVVQLIVHYCYLWNYLTDFTDEYRFIFKRTAL